MKRRDFLKLSLVSGAILSSPALLQGAAERRPSPEAQSDAELDQLIEKHRKVDVRIQVGGHDGSSLKGARVEVNQTAHEFLFGCNFFCFDRCENPEQEELYRNRFAAVFNYCTLGFYWASFEPSPNSPGYAYTDRVLEWTQRAGLRCKGHPLVWDHRAGSPAWLPEDSGELKAKSDGRVRELTKRYQGKMAFWDVVNEPTHLAEGVNKTRMALWGKELGAEAYTRRPLEIARAQDPHARLLVNDYRLGEDYHALLEKLLTSDSKLFDAIGLQCHMHSGAWEPGKARAICDRYTGLGLPLHFTEMTLVSGPRLGRGENWGPTQADLEQTQAEGTRRFYRELFAHPSVEAITWWDFSDYRAWQRAAAGWVRRDMSPKPVYEEMRRLIREHWWTRSSIETDASGQVSLRAFPGRHQVTVTLANGGKTTREIEIGRKAVNQISMKI